MKLGMRKIAFIMVFLLASCQSAPHTIDFETVFGEVTETPFQRDLLEEINRNEDLCEYKLSLLPENPIPQRVLFYGITKGFGKYPNPTKCKIVVPKDYKFQARLYLRKMNGNKATYEHIPIMYTIEHDGKSELVVIGRIEPPEGKRVGDLSKLIHLEVVK